MTDKPKGDLNDLLRRLSGKLLREKLKDDLEKAVAEAAELGAEPVDVIASLGTVLYAVTAAAFFLDLDETDKVLGGLSGGAARADFINSLKDHRDDLLKVRGTVLNKLDKTESETIDAVNDLTLSNFDKFIANAPDDSGDGASTH